MGQEIDRFEEHVPFYDVPEGKPLEFEVDGETVTARPGKTGVGLFWERPELNYVAIEDDEAYHVIFNQDFARWIGGLALDEFHVELVRNSKRDSFYDVYHWRPRVVIDSLPNPGEINYWIEHISADLDIPGAWEDN